jgi:hypothetical protein
MYRCIAAGVFCVFAMPDFHSAREGHHLAENSPMVRVPDKKLLILRHNVVVILDLFKKLWRN